MWKYGVMLLCLSGYCLAGPVGVLKRNVPIGQQKANDDDASYLEPISDEMMVMSTLNLPSNATSIRADITDNFSCDNKRYGYYADIENDCQIFHVCLPVTYADGKENTFRWSFICPEETVFSQDSFTCMRPGDMIISCEESFKYYDLNSNFGNVEEESEKEMNEMPALEANQPILEAEPEEETREPEEPVVPMLQPVKVQKPNRRKPGLSYAVQKKPSSSYPLRKIPQLQPQLNANANGQNFAVKETVEPVEEYKKEAEEEEIKPVLQKFSRRPVPVMSNSFKDKMPNSKPEIVNAIRSDIFNQKRKRPTVFNKKPTEEESEKTDEVLATEEIFPPPGDNPEQTLPQMTPEILNTNKVDKAEAEPAKEESPEPAQVPEQTFFQMAPELSNANTETQAADSEIQASETNEFLVKPQESEPPQVVEEPVNAEEPQVLEAIEDIPAVIAEVEETGAQSTNKNSQHVEEITKEQLQTAEEPQAPEEIPAAAENQTSQELNSGQETQTAVETDTIEENIRAAEEPQTVEAAKPSGETQAVEVAETTGEIQTLEESQAPEQTADDNQISQEIVVAEEFPAFQETEAVSNEVQTVEEPEVVEKASTSEESQTSIETQAPTEEQVNPEDTKSVIESEMPEETEISLENQIALTNEPHAAEESLGNEMIPAAEPVQSAGELSASSPDETIVLQEDTKQEEPAETATAEEDEHMKSELVDGPEQDPSVFAEPSIFEENSEESVVALPAQTIEEMEDEKPAEAPESMPESQEMAHQNPIVQQMFEESTDEDRKQTIGGFKPVDPVMAAEAEQLIADFINTLRKNEFVNEKPGMPMQMPSIEEAVKEYSEDMSGAGEELAVEEEKVNETQEQAEEVKSDQSDEILTQPQIVEAQVSAEESNAEELENAQPSQEEAKLDEAYTSVEASKAEETAEEELLTQEPAMMMPNVHQDIYQIPVQVITNPLEEMQQQESEKQPEAVVVPMEILSNTDGKQESEAPAVVMDGYKPLSIDDIVELVKERLDQMPKDKMETPMQLEQVLSEVKPNDEQDAVDLSQTEDEQAQESSQPEEEIVLPIYHRTAEVGQVDTPVQDESAVAVDNRADPILPQEKSSRFFRSRSLLSPKVDSRKRRFRFRSDAS